MNRDHITGALLDATPAWRNLREEILTGLSASPRTLPCKFFYDDRGAKLFREICDRPEYYITRSELEILRLHGSEIGRMLQADAELIGLGTGAGTKTRILLDEMERPAVYIPIDISKEQLERSVARFRQIFPQLQILPVCADYLEAFELPLPRRPSARSVVYFPGSTIGNFDPAGAITFLRRLTDLAGDGGGLLIGVDLQKDRYVIERAYNDRAGITAEFNLNLLARVNREFGADFDLRQWHHRAIYNADQGRVEMYLISAVDQSVHIEDKQFDFHSGEEILTEYSYKYTPEGFVAVARQAGLEFRKIWKDQKELFGVFYFVVS